VFSEVAAKQLGASKLDILFPGFTGPKSEWLGVL
jgi:hypothetical protein